jgi:hypothetical protein
MCFSSGDGGAAARARADEDARQARIKSGTEKINQTFSQFDDSFYQKRAEDFKAFAAPEAERQYKDANRDLLFNLARSGNLASSERARQMSVVDRERDMAAMRIADKGQEYANQARQQVEQNRTDLINQTMASGDDTLAANQARQRVGMLNTSPAFEGLGSLFETTGGIIKSTRNVEAYQPWAPGMSAFTSPGKSSRMVGDKK